ncbi:BlaI/MecI/CopY family transcriptional regulator [Hufsiella ginkgonis]|uniref:Soluble adenylyl cyclase-like protein n=1 Tax=Hufsiella ginkgonis TaxID=2695274 RepID=A0A7K1XYN3_9SPHI|nr:BlaI/MecI/CopY family transcriptional regulator [Hufsiella ginkgonis]MXV16063.1 hypothetical protein [Hufsiella ginkgonis]
MPKVTEQDVVTFLEEKVQSLHAELKKAQELLQVFTGTLSATQTNAFKSPVLPLSGAKRGRKPRPAGADSAMIVAPAEFHPKAKMELKVAYALSQTGPAFKEEVTRVLNDLDPEADPKKLDKDVTVKLSSLYKKGRINAVREGRKYKYSL